MAPSPASGGASMRALDRAHWAPAASWLCPRRQRTRRDTMGLVTPRPLPPRSRVRPPRRRDRSDLRSEPDSPPAVAGAETANSTAPLYLVAVTRGDDLDHATSTCPSTQSPHGLYGTGWPILGRTRTSTTSKPAENSTAFDGYVETYDVVVHEQFVVADDVAVEPRTAPDDRDREIETVDVEPAGLDLSTHSRLFVRPSQNRGTSATRAMLTGSTTPAERADFRN